MSRRAAWIAAGLTLVAFALRLYRLDYLALRGDESFTVLFVAQPLAEMWEGIRAIEPNPPLYYLLLRGTAWLWGSTDFAARFLSAFFGVLAVPLLYRLALTLLVPEPGDGAGPAARTAGQASALVAALFLAINPFQIWHSQDVRNYTLWPALSLASLCCLALALRQPRGRSWLWAGYVATALLSLYSHYYDVMVLLAENAFVLLFYRRSRPVLGRWLLSQAILAVLYLPWLLFGSSRPLDYQDETAVLPGLLGMAGRYLSAFGLGETLPPALASILVPLLAVLLVLGLAAALRQDRRLFGFLGLYLAVPILCTFALAQWRPLFRERYLNATAPGYYLAFALALVALGRRRLGRVLAGVIALALLLVPAGLALGHYYFDPAYAKSADWRGLTAYLEAQATADDVIALNYPDPTLERYYQGPARLKILPDRPAVDRVGDQKVNRLATGSDLEQLLAAHRRLWFLPSRSVWDPDGYVEGWLERRARRVAETQLDLFRVVAYERVEAQPPPVTYPQEALLGEEVQLLGYDLGAEGGCRVAEAGAGSRAASGASAAAPGITIFDPASCRLSLVLHWQSLALLDRNYTVFCHLLGEDGSIWGQHDGQPQDGSFPTWEWYPGDRIADRHVLALRPDAPPGRYQLAVGMYHLETATRLPARLPDGRPWPNDAVILDAPILLDLSIGTLPGAAAE